MLEIFEFEIFGYSAQHCQMTVPKLILLFLGSLGEIGGPVVCGLRDLITSHHDVTIEKE